MTINANMDTESRPIKWLNDEFAADHLFVDQSFQRNFIWTIKDRIALIETIILGYPIPEIYLWQTGTDPQTGDTKYSIIDGQQRITTVGLFLRDDLKLTTSGLEFTDPRYVNKTFSQLDPDIKSAIWSYKVSLRFVRPNVSRDDIVKMFLRLNKTSNALNPQELRNAEFSGKFLEVSERIADLPIWNKHGLFREREIRRMQDVQFSSTLLIFTRAGFEDETTQAAINKMYDLYNDEYRQSESDYSKIEVTLNLIDECIDIQPSLKMALSKKTHLYTVFTVIFAYQDAGIFIEIPKAAAALAEWFSWAVGGVIPIAEFANSIQEYVQLSQEGVQKKANRLRRYQLLDSFLQLRLDIARY